MTAPLVSIVMRTMQNRGGYLAEALASVKAQTYSRIEVIVVEDGSDTAAPLLQASGVQGKHLPLAKSGRCLAGNVGLAAASGDYICFLDDDDQFFPNHIETLVNAIGSAPAVYSLAECRDTQLISLQPLQYTEIARHVPKIHDAPFFPTMAMNNIVAIQSVLFRRTLFEQYGGFAPELDHFEDWDLWVRYAQAGAFTCVPVVTSFYRRPAGDKQYLHRFQTAAQYRPLVQKRFEQYHWQVNVAKLHHLATAPYNLYAFRQWVWGVMHRYPWLLKLRRWVKL